MTEPIIAVELTDVTITRRRECLFCGGSDTSKAAVVAEVLSTVEVDPFDPAPQRTGLVICPRCLELTPEARATAIREHAAWLRARAAELDAIARDQPTLPTFAEWQARNLAAECLPERRPARPS
jgi:hypothetical protein